MLKAKTYDIADSNIANLGSDLEKKVRQAAASGEEQWKTAGKQVGLQIWRIEKFKVVPVKRSDYGTFYSGDSYIILNTYKKKPESGALSFDVHFWLGTNTTQDEAGTAAYKTVELDDFLGCAPVQHREVEGHESQLFLSYFKQGGMKILDGGVESGFRHVAPQEYKSRLLWIKGKQTTVVTQVAMSYKSLNSGDVFILDAGLKVYQWNGSQSGPREKQRGALLTKALRDERSGKPEVFIIEESDSKSSYKEFWTSLGGEGPIASADSVATDEEWENQTKQKLSLYRLSDESGKIQFSKVAQGSEINRSHFDTNDAFIFDVGYEVYIWIGKSASVSERKKALQYAQYYIKNQNLPVWLPITRIMEGGENEVFESYFGGPSNRKTTNTKPTTSTAIPSSVNLETAKSDADILYRAMKGLGTNESLLISVFGKRSRDHMIVVAQEFAKTYKKPLTLEVQSETSGNFRLTLLSLLKSLVEYKAEELYFAMKGLGTNEAALLDVLTQSTNDEIKIIKEIYGKLYGKGDNTKLERDIIGDTSGNFKKVLLELIKGSRDESNGSNDQALKDAEIIHQKGEGRIGTDDNYFVSFFTSKSTSYLQQVDKAYQQKYNKPLYQAIKAETSGDYKDSLIALCKPASLYWAERAHDAMKGLGTKDRQLIRVIVTNTRSQLQEIQKVYQLQFGKSMRQDVADDTSGDYRKLLLSLLD